MKEKEVEMPYATQGAEEAELPLEDQVIDEDEDEEDEDEEDEEDEEEEEDDEDEDDD